MQVPPARQHLQRIVLAAPWSDHSFIDPNAEGS